MFEKLKLRMIKNEGTVFFLVFIVLVVFISSQINLGDDTPLAADSIVVDSLSADANNILALIQILDQIELDEDLVVRLSRYKDYIVFPVQIEQNIRTGVSNPFFAN